VAFEITQDLHPDLMPIAWMIGRWEGSGKGTYPGTEDFDFGQQVDFAHNGGSYLHYLSQTFETDAAGKAVRPLTMETGFWRPQPDGELEVLITHATGITEIFYGRARTLTSWELETDAVVRTASAKDVVSSHRLYGLVDGGDLAYVDERAMMGQPQQPHLSAQLRRIAG
jgi:hypothetical protein